RFNVGKDAIYVKTAEFVLLNILLFVPVGVLFRLLGVRMKPGLLFSLSLLIHRTDTVFYLSRALRDI
ncbi:MAG: hypothetical protein LUH00_05390, partial [Lachnospiraceae bacterium]|nr:hypothetical protein [Lachnospiraceae bacterium]